MFELNLEENFFEIREALRLGIYRPEPYSSFFVSDPKLRHIHKACVRDRVVHQAMFRVLYPLFDKAFIHDSYSCRDGKGTHRGVRQLQRYLRKASANYSRPVYALKCDIKKFFDSINHHTLLCLLERRIRDTETIELVRKVVASFESAPGNGLPLGNVTSQLFANVYLNELDQWAKHELKARYYLRYCDDFIIVHRNRQCLKAIVPQIAAFLQSIRLELHAQKTKIHKAVQGVDFLGYVVLPHAVMLRTRTKRRMLRNISDKNRASYLGMLSHANARKLRAKIASK